VQHKPSQKRQSRVHTYYGEAIAAPLVEWLNGGPPAAPKRNSTALGKRLAAVDKVRAKQLSLAQKAQRIQRLERLLQVADQRAGTADAQELEHLDREIQTILSQYRMYPVVIAWSPRHWMTDWRPLARRVPQEEGTALLKLLTLAEQGLLPNLKRCANLECKQWFFARYSHQKCHTDACRLARLQADPDRRESRKRYMRESRKHRK
jgi:hypothetical protein